LKAIRLKISDLANRPMDSSFPLRAADLHPSLAVLWWDCVLAGAVSSTLQTATSTKVDNNNNNNNVACPLAESYIDRAAHEAGAAAEMAASHKVEKYLDLGARYIFEPVAIETLGIFNASARHLLNDLVRRITLNLGEARDKLPVSKDLDISASMLSFYMTVCRLLTARIEDRTCFSYFSFNF